ncbi:hypothetical protein GCM10017690_22290 [Microbacterium terregens]
MEQPSWDDDAVAWRRFAGGLRERMGEANRRAADAEARALDAEERAALAEAEADRLTRRSKRSRWQLTRLEKLLAEGDVAAAVDLLAYRRAGIRSIGGRHSTPDCRLVGGDAALRGVTLRSKA